MMGKIAVSGIFIFCAVMAMGLIATTYTGYSAEYQTGSTTMNVTIRGYVSISASNCLTNGISFATQDPNTDNNNGTCNSVTANSGTGYNISVDGSSTVSINFTHAGNRTNLTDGTNDILINSNLTYNSNNTENNASQLRDPVLSEALKLAWKAMGNCTNLADNENCWATYFLDIPSGQDPGSYYIGYCWCGRQVATDESNCGTCT